MMNKANSRQKGRHEGHYQQQYLRTYANKLLRTKKSCGEKFASDWAKRWHLHYIDLSKKKRAN